MYRSLTNCNSGGFLSSNYSIRKFGHSSVDDFVLLVVMDEVCGTIDRKANLTNLFDTIIFVIKSQLTVSDNDGYVHAVRIACNSMETVSSPHILSIYLSLFFIYLNLNCGNDDDDGGGGGGGSGGGTDGISTFIAHWSADEILYST
ncbi:hypothetical protein T07_7107 [Trichinella nelsoni]|uniref:Uncharacterized protein n=1 Tax=Trichinella nelsoni TaxID=6336 RepID=A0A0V0S9S8_9BILA|nr:hypothetical protein T07_7107 [Trichinella nelsoni]